MIGLRLMLAAAGLISAAFSPYLHAQRLVDIGGRRMNLYCTGSGSPTVILDAPLGASTIVWRNVQPALAQHLRVCSYDRAGYGFSDPAMTPRTTAANVDDLHALLQHAGIKPPYILVAHSLNAFDARLFADRYRAQVAGLVLVDPSDEHESRFAAIEGEKQFKAEAAADDQFISDCDRKAHKQALKAGDDCVGPPNPAFPAALQRVDLRHTTSAAMWDAVKSEHAALPADIAIITHAQRPYGALPLIVLSSEKPAAEKALWKTLYDEEASLSTLGVQRIVAGATHYIETDRPDAVIDAVLEIAGRQADPIAPPEPAAVPDVRTLYTDALHAMSDLPQPEYVTYRLTAQSEGLQVDLVTMSGAVWLNVHGGSAPADWTLRHQTDDYASTIVDNHNGRQYQSARSFFDPTWYGAYRALHEGMFDSQDPAPPRPQASATPVPPAALKTIAIAAVMGPGIYTLEDRGASVCSSGDPGRALHLTSRTRDPHHQLTDVVIDLRYNRFCLMRFAESSGFGFHGFLEQHYGDVGGYWMQTDGFLDGTIRAFGIAFHHGVWRYHLADMAFPRRI